MKTKEWFAQWLSVYVKGQVKPRTYTMYSQLTKNHIAPYIGEIEIVALSQEDIRQFVYVDICQNKALAASTINSIIMVTHLALSVAEDIGIIATNPCNKIRRLPIPKQPVDAFTRAEQQTIERYIVNKRKLKLLGVLICLYMGLRIGELLALTWSDVDLRTKTIYVTKTAGDKGETYSTKTQAGTRIIPIPNNLLAVFATLKKNATCQYVIETKGKRTSIRAYRELYRRMLQKAGVRPLRFHSLRYTFATRAIECGMDFKTLSELMGHASIVITLNRYAHCQMEQKRKAINRLAKLNNGN